MYREGMEREGERERLTCTVIEAGVVLICMIDL